eukprot:jgi/Phyca11/119339/e_gw1.38.192.1
MKHARDTKNQHRIVALVCLVCSVQEKDESIGRHGQPQHERLRTKNGLMSEPLPTMGLPWLSICHVNVKGWVMDSDPLYAYS